MGWIKRNLLFSIGGALAILLLLAAGYYDLKSYSHNSAAFGRLNEIYSKLQELGNQKPAPGNSTVDNIAAAREQEKAVRAWNSRAGDYFKPILPIPDSTNVTSEAFAAALRRTIDQLQRDAQTASVVLPPKYGFSFEAQRSLVKFSPGSLAALAVQLGEVTTLSKVLFGARVNALDGIQRCRASEDDLTGPQTDYNNEVAVTNNLAVLTPYIITFRGFSYELAAVLKGFAKSPYGVIVKGLSVQPAGAAQGTEAGGPGGPAPALNPRRGEMPTVIQPQLLRFTLQVEIVKLLPKPGK